MGKRHLADTGGRAIGHNLGGMESGHFYIKTNMPFDPYLGIT